MNFRQKIIESGRKTLKVEAESLLNLVDLIDEQFALAVQEILSCKGRVVITGIGKSANVAQKIVATLNSTGTPSVFMHAADAIHGDLGIVQSDDIVICISNSGNSPEIKALIPFIKSMGNKIVGIVGNAKGYLAQNADFVISSFVEKEACTNNLAPTSSTTAQMALGDAIAVCLINEKGFTAADFAKSHPGGALGKQLYLKVDDLVAANDKPKVSASVSVKEAIYEMSSKRLGATAVLNEQGKVEGIITDGDIRRMLEAEKNVADLTAGDIMGKSPKTIALGSLASNAMQILKENNITQIIVVDDQENYVGIVHLHDLIREGLSE